MKPAMLRVAGVAAVVVAVIVVLMYVGERHGRSRQGGAASRTQPVVRRQARPATAPRRAAPRSGGAASGAGSARSLTAHLSLADAVGQLVISTYAGTTPSARILRAVRAGRTGAIILMGDNTTRGILAVRSATDALQAAARAGGRPGLLIMTDQEGGEVKRLPGPPDLAASGMTDPRVAHHQGLLTGRLLRRAGVNLDLAPVADVTRTNGFMTEEQRTFGSDPTEVARASCSFASGLARARVGYTLKHFPGLGDAVDSTDNGPVTISESAAELHADDLAYRRCAGSPDAAVMVSSASYSHLTGSTPAVLSSHIYRDVMPADGIHGLTMSDSFESPAIEPLPSAAMTAIDAGLDMVLYPGTESAAADAYAELLSAARRGVIPRSRVLAAAAQVLAFKRHLGLPGR